MYYLVSNYLILFIMNRKFYKSFLAVAILVLPLMFASAQTAITSADDLDLIRADLSGSYYLTGDITLPDGDWLPIGAENSEQTDALPFTGTFDGKGYTIKNLKFDYRASAGNGKGFFARLNNQAVVKDVGFEDVDIAGTDQCGTVAGQFTGESVIERVWVTGKVEGKSTTGGLIGGVPVNNDRPDYNTIQDCYVNIELLITEKMGGGIVGQLANANAKIQITNVLVAGKLNSSPDILSSNINKIGGLFGVTGSVHPKINSVAIVCDEITGYMPNFIYSGNQYPTEVNKAYVRDDVNLIYYNEEDKGKGSEYDKMDIHFNPLSEFKTKDFYTTNLNWDFDNVWTINEGEFPMLKIQQAASGLSNLPESINCKIYPLNNEIVIEPTGKVSVSIYDLAGKLMLSQTTSAKLTVPVESGFYMVEIQQHENTSVKKLLVK